MAGDIVPSPHDVLDGASAIASISRLVLVVVEKRQIGKDEIEQIKERAAHAKTVRLRGYLKELTDMRIDDIVELSAKINVNQESGALRGPALDEAYRALEEYARDMSKIKDIMMASAR